MKNWKLGFLASHRGTNMQAIIDACHDGRIAAEPVVVISNNGKAGALDRARNAGIPAYHFSPANFADEGELDRVMTDALQRHGVDLVLLAGFMRKVGEAMLTAFPGRILNVHPALLPGFGGKGMYGMKVHEAVLAAGETESGATIHVVDAGYDTGRILAQRRVPVEPGDTPETLAARVLRVEHEAYVDCVRRITRGEIPL